MAELLTDAPGIGNNLRDYEARRVGKQLNGFGKIPPGRFVEVEHDGNKIELSKAFTKCVQHGFSLSP